jgi:hypothetical protein
VPLHCRMRVFDRDLIRGGHYGQRSCEPHKQAEHMAAPTSMRREESPCQLGAVHTWHLVSFTALQDHVRDRGMNGLAEDRPLTSHSFALGRAKCRRLATWHA